MKTTGMTHDVGCLSIKSVFNFAFGVGVKEISAIYVPKAGRSDRFGFFSKLGLF